LLWRLRRVKKEKITVAKNQKLRYNVHGSIQVSIQEAIDFLVYSRKVSKLGGQWLYVVFRK